MKLKTNAHKKNSKNFIYQNPSFEEIIQELRRLMPELASNYGVASLGLFGSFIRGEQKRGSDLDLLVDFGRVPTLFQFIRLEKDLKEKLGLKVDLVMKSALKRNIGQQILREVITV